MLMRILLINLHSKSFYMCFSGMKPNGPTFFVRSESEHAEITGDKH